MKNRSNRSLHGLAQEATNGTLKTRLNRQPFGYKKVNRKKNVDGPVAQSKSQDF
jgi:hypothetical protein